MFANSGEITPPCGVPATVRSTPCSVNTPARSHLPTSFSTRRSETLRPTSPMSTSWSRLSKKTPDIGLGHMGIPPRKRLTDGLLRTQRRSLRAKPERAVLEVSFENRLQHDLRCGLSHPVSHRGNPQRSVPACWFRDVHTPRRRGTIRART